MAAMLTADTNAAEPTVSARVARVSLVLLLTINLFNYIDRYILAAVEPELRKEFFPQAAGGPAVSAKDELARAMSSTGWLATAFLISYMVTAPLFGAIANRMSRWVLIAIAVTVWSLASGASGLAATFAVLLITRCFVGVGEAGYGPAAPALIAELYSAKNRGFIMALFYMAIPVGSALGYVFGGLITAKMDGVGGIHGWRWPFFLVVLPGIALAIWALMMRKHEPARHVPAIPAADPAVAAENGGRPAAKPRFSVRQYLSIFKIPSYTLDTAGMTAMTFAIGGFSFWLPAYLVDHAHVGGDGASPKEVLSAVNFKFGVIMAVCGITATLAGGWLGDYFKRHFSGSYFVVSAAGILLSALFIVLMIHTPFPTAWVWLTLAVFFLFLNTGPSNTILANVTSPANRAQAFAVNIFVIHALGDAISPPILGQLVGKYSWNAALYLVVAVMVVASALWLWGAVYLKRDEERAVSGAPVEGRGFPVIEPSEK
ncbi:MAG TPA: MFS transporter [Tepidisphaeraceae bacterium]|nr:MFS transporter [Tepidisphaeraceae bacterium]